MNEPTQQPTVTISARLLDKIATYLVSRPFSEVAGLIGELQAELTPQAPPTPPASPAPASNEP